MMFEIGIQLFSNIDRKFIFQIDMSKKLVIPERLTLDEIQASLRGDDYLDCSNEHTKDSTPLSNDSITQKNSNETLPNDSVQLSDFTIIDSNESDDDSDYNPLDDSESHLDDDEIVGWNVTEIETSEPNQSLYRKDRFITKVHIEKMMELGNFVTKGHQFSRKDKRKNKNLRTIRRSDVVARAVRYASLKLTTGETSVQNVTKNDPILEGASGYQIPSSKSLNKGWGRRYKTTEGGTYGRKYVTKYKDIIRELYERGNKDSSNKMNPAMIREYLADKYPTTYSLPGETEIKQHISSLVQNDKKGESRKKKNENVSDPQDWVNIIEQIVQNDKLGAPESLYNTFITQYNSNDGNRESSNAPDKNTVKRKISYLKTKYKNIAHHAIL